MTQETLREASRLLQDFYLSPSFDPKSKRRADTVEAAIQFTLDTMQPEIDRRVAEERARLLERLREPSEANLASVASQFYAEADITKWASRGYARRAFAFVAAQFEKEQQP